MKKLLVDEMDGWMDDDAYLYVCVCVREWMMAKLSFDFFVLSRKLHNFLSPFY